MKKAFYYLFAVVILFCLNFILLYTLSQRSRRFVSTQKILTEIGQEYDPHTQFNRSSAPLVLGESTMNIESGDGRIANLKQFFRKYNSPLYDDANVIIEVSDNYKFDYRLIPAIAMQESNLCKYIPENSYNCWGWGIYGNRVTRFDSYEEAIRVIAKGLREQYLDKGLVRASEIMQKYTPSSNGSWAHGVNTFLGVLE